ncbi:unnamed protein product [Lathyrus sativus]|nr:unnamed protein product [Lathyrus sativus]
MKKGRGWPKTTVPPSSPPESLSSLKTPQSDSRTTTPPNPSSKTPETGAKIDKEMEATLGNAIKETPAEVTKT